MNCHGTILSSNIQSIGKYFEKRTGGMIHMNAIFHRTSIRKYTDQPVEKKKIEQLLRAARAAPSAENQQTC